MEQIALKVEEKIHFQKFVPRDYQLPICKAIEKGDFKRVLLVWPRRSGKDVLLWNLLIRAALRKVGVYFYILPTYAQAKKVIWTSITNSGVSFKDYIPDTLIESSNSQEMSINLTNGSRIQLVGSDNIDSLVGTNPQGIVYSEAALQLPTAFTFLRPVLAANAGFAWFCSTPRGKNWFWAMFEMAKQQSDWFVSKLSLDDTKHIPLYEIEKERAEGLMSEDLIQQEYYTSFEMGVEGSYYCKYIDKMKIDNRIADVPWEPQFKVHTAWDIGNDTTAIIFFQVVGQIIRIIDYYENSGSGVGLEHYAKIVLSQPFVYGFHVFPHDMEITEWGGPAETRLEKARKLGLKGIICKKRFIDDGIEIVRSKLPLMWMDAIKCDKLIKVLENYRQEYDPKHNIYRGVPLHNWASHGCFTGDTLILTRTGMRPIIEIQDNDQVLTLEGWKPCTRSIKTITNAQLVGITFNDGTIVRCTPVHPFMQTDYVWKYAKDLTSSTKIQSSLIPLFSTLMEQCINYGEDPIDTFSKAVLRYIEMFGQMPLEQSQKIATFIIKTLIQQIIIYGTSNVSQLQNIESSLSPIVRDLARKLEMLLHNGTQAPQADYGMQGMLNVQRAGINGSEKCDHAYIAQSYLIVLFEQMDINKSSVMQTAKHLMVEKVENLTETEDVYCLSVPGYGYFSLSNGAIVKNSDAMRYLCISLDRTKDGISSAEIENYYREALGGSQSHLPSVFRDDLPNY